MGGNRRHASETVRWIMAGVYFRNLMEGVRATERLWECVIVGNSVCQITVEWSGNHVRLSGSKGGSGQ